MNITDSGKQIERPVGISPQFRNSGSQYRNVEPVYLSFKITDKQIERPVGMSDLKSEMLDLNIGMSNQSIYHFTGEVHQVNCTLHDFLRGHFLPVA